MINCLVDTSPSNQALIPLFERELFDENGKIKVNHPLTDIFYVLQVLRPGALRVEETIADNFGDTYGTRSRIYPPQDWLTTNKDILITILGSPEIFIAFYDLAIRNTC